MSELIKGFEEKKDIMKQILKKLHSGEDVEKLKNEFKNVLTLIAPIEIPIIEQALVKDGISPKEIAKLCDLHVELLRGFIEKSVDFSDLEEGHPLKTLIQENEQILKDAEILSLYSGALKDNPEKSLKEIKSILKDLSMIGPTHYSKEEMLLFPYIEKLGITAVPTVLWTKHDEIRAKIKTVKSMVNKNLEEIKDILPKHISELSAMLIDMVYRENNIFYPTLKVLLEDSHWKAVKLQEPEYGHYKVQPGDIWNPSIDPIFPYQFKPEIDAEKLISMPAQVRNIFMQEKPKIDDYVLKREKDIDLENGFLNPKELNLIFKNIPVDITFIDSQDRVRFFSGGERIFNRSKNILGRPVQLCHPPKSVHIVEKILKAFKEGKKDSADFWINFGNRMVYIKYLAIRDKDGKYIGTLEITQDITYLRNLKGEKRLLDWE